MLLLLFFFVLYFHTLQHSFLWPIRPWTYIRYPYNKSHCELLAYLQLNKLHKLNKIFFIRDLYSNPLTLLHYLNSDSPHFDSLQWRTVTKLEQKLRGLRYIRRFFMDKCKILCLAHIFPFCHCRNQDVVQIESPFLLV